MFPDDFLPQILFFLLTQATAFGLLRTGMLVWGFSVMVLGWVLGDLALILHFVFPSHVTAYALSLWGLQLLALLGFPLFFGWRWLRRRESFRSIQERIYGEALDHFMAGRDEEARERFSRLVQRDPWDVEALLFLARLDEHQLTSGRAIRRMSRGLRLSGESSIAKEIEEEMRCLKRRRKGLKILNVKRPQAPKPKAPERKAAS